MAYFTMDHANWVEHNNAAGRQNAARLKPKKDRNGDTIGWHVAPEKLSPFQVSVMDILWIVGGGIYNAPISWDTVAWNYGRGLSVVWRGSLATFDSDKLTKLVFLCHEARIRCEIDPAGPRALRLSFWPRVHAGAMHCRHPDLSEALKAFEALLPTSHRLRYAVAPSEAVDVPALADAAG